jgi:molybdopterin converting factor small subunit
MITQILHFLSRHYLIILIVSIPLLFIVIREIILVTRRKKEAQIIEKNIQEKYNRIETLKDELSQQKKTLLENFKTLNKLTANIANDQKKAPKDTDIKHNDNT